MGFWGGPKHSFREAEYPSNHRPLGPKLKQRVTRGLEAFIRDVVYFLGFALFLCFTALLIYIAFDLRKSTVQVKDVLSLGPHGTWEQSVHWRMTPLRALRLAYAGLRGSNIPDKNPPPWVIPLAFRKFRSSIEGLRPALRLLLRQCFKIDLNSSFHIGLCWIIPPQH